MSKLIVIGAVFGLSCLALGYLIGYTISETNKEEG